MADGVLVDVSQILASVLAASSKSLMCVNDSAENSNESLHDQTVQLIYLWAFIHVLFCLRPVYLPPMEETETCTWMGPAVLNALCCSEKTPD